MTKTKTKKVSIENLRDLLLREWDPLGVGVSCNSADEYDSFLGKIYDSILDGASEKEMCELLVKFEIMLGVCPSRERCLYVAKNIIQIVNN